MSKIVKHKSGLFVREDTYDSYVLSEIRRSYGHMDVHDKIVLDVGANIGGYSRFAVDNGAKYVWAFEPDAQNFDMLVMNTPHKVKHHREALISGNDTTISFYRTKSGKNPGNYSTEYFKGREEIKVPARNFQCILNVLQPDVIKMDCEGAEYDLLLNSVLPASVKQISLEIHFSKPAWRLAKAPELFKLFDGWRVVKEPKVTDVNWQTIGAWER